MQLVKVASGSAAVEVSMRRSVQFGLLLLAQHMRVRRGGLQCRHRLRRCYLFGESDGYGMP
jgi:hypothetical protein